jgi:hypothetical protein
VAGSEGATTAAAKKAAAAAIAAAAAAQHKEEVEEAAHAAKLALKAKLHPRAKHRHNPHDYHHVPKTAIVLSHLSRAVVGPVAAAATATGDHAHKSDSDAAHDSNPHVNDHGNDHHSGNDKVAGLPSLLGLDINNPNPNPSVEAASFWPMKKLAKRVSLLDTMTETEKADVECAVVYACLQSSATGTFALSKLMDVLATATFSSEKTELMRQVLHGDTARVKNAIHRLQQRGEVDVTLSSVPDGNGAVEVSVSTVGEITNINDGISLVDHELAVSERFGPIGKMKRNARHGLVQQDSSAEAHFVMSLS